MADIESWELRKADLTSRGFYRNDTTSHPAMRELPTDEFQQRDSRKDSFSNEYSPYQPRKQLSRSGSDVRFVDPALRAVSRDSNAVFAPKAIIQANCGDYEAPTGRLSALSIKESSNIHGQAGDRCNGPSTYRCQPFDSSTTPSALSSSASSSSSSRVNSRSSVKVVSCTIGKSGQLEESNDLIEQPEVQRYDLNGTRIVEFSSSCANLSDRAGSTSRLNETKRRAYDEWLVRKRAEETRRKEESRRIGKQSEEDRIARERVERDARERENFSQWRERKKREEAMKRESIERELEFERRLKEVEDNAVVAKTIYLRQWARKKEVQQKALQREQEVRKKREDEERKKRLEESEKAYVKWREISKNRPRPATQGLLPHQTARPSYVNPNPWIMDDVEPEETTRKQSSGEMRKMGVRDGRSNAGKSIVTKQ